MRKAVETFGVLGALAAVWATLFFNLLPIELSPEIQSILPAVRLRLPRPLELKLIPFSLC